MMSNRFSFFAPAYLAKGEDAPSLNNPVKVGGVLTTEDKDVDNEIISKSSDWSFFEGGFGKIKFEHKEYKEPFSIIGFPTKLIRKGSKTAFEGELIPFDPNTNEQKSIQKSLAKAAYDLLKEIEEHNKRHPEMPQKAGWSIEGEYLEKDKKTGLVKARIINVVLTTKPRNRKTYAEILSKALEVGHGVSPETQTGFGALREESIDGVTKKQTLTKNGETEMFTTKEEVYKKAIEEGKTPEEAKKLAEEFEAKKNSTVGEGYAETEKSLGTAKDKLQKSVSLIGELEKVDVDTSPELIAKQLSKSISVGVGEEFDATEFFKAQSRGLAKSIEAIDAINQKVDLLAKSVQMIAESKLAEIDSLDYIRNVATMSRQEVNQMEKSLALFAKGIAKSMGSNLMSDLSAYSVADNDKPLTSGNLTKSQILTTLDKLEEKGQISSKDVTTYESTNFIDDRVLEMVKKELSQS